jgi:hypothetical protein
MRIEIVVDVPTISNPEAVDAIRYGQEVVRLVRNDIHGQPASLVHTAVGAGISVPRDFDESASVHNADDGTHPYRDTVTPHNEDRDDNVTSPYAVSEPEETEAIAQNVPVDERENKVHAGDEVDVNNEPTDSRSAVVEVGGGPEQEFVDPEGAADKAEEEIGPVHRDEDGTPSPAINEVDPPRVASNSGAPNTSDDPRVHEDNWAAPEEHGGEG